MLLFCPNCSNALTITKSQSHDLENVYACSTCPYQFPIKGELVDRKKLAQKKVDDVLGGEASWKNVDRTPVQCTKGNCESEEAFYFQLQIRSADEPSEWR